MSDVMIETYPERTSTQESGYLPVRMTVNGEARLDGRVMFNDTIVRISSRNGD